MRGQRAKELLRQYIDAGKEIEETERFIKKLNKDVIKDSVVGSSPNYPYNQHKIIIEGTPHTKIARQERYLQNQVKKCIDIRTEVIEFIGTIPDSRMRRIFKLRYLEGMNWLKISRLFGANYESYARVLHDNYLNSL